MKNSYEVCGDVVTVRLKRKKYDDVFFTVSLQDFEKVNSITGSWTVHYAMGEKLYVKTRFKRINQVFLHRFLMGDHSGMDIDHINGDSLNNERSNLRLLTHSDNSKNRVRANKNNTTTKVRGVSEMKTGKYRAQVKRNYKSVHIGVFDNKKDAEDAVLRQNAS